MFPKFRKRESRALSKPAEAYGGKFAAENEVIRAENTFFGMKTADEVTT